MRQKPTRYNSNRKKIWFLGSLFALCFVVPLSAPQTDQKSGDEQSDHYARGVRARQLGLYDEAVEAFQEVLRLNPENAEAYCELGAVYRFKEKTDNALDAYLRALELPASEQTRGVAHLCLARIYHSQGKFADAENHGQHAVAMLPKNAEPSLRLADTYVQRGKLELAQQAYQQALTLDTNLAPVYQGLGKVAFLQNRLPEAIQHYQKALILEPYHAETRYTLALVHRRLGHNSQKDAATQHITEAKNLMAAFQQVKTYNEQINRYRRNLLEQPTALELHVKLAEAHLKIGNYQDAIRTYQIATALHPDTAPLYHNLGGLYMQTGQLTEAVTAFQRFIQLDDADSEVYLHLGWLHARLRKLDDAQAYLQKAIQRDKTLTPAYYGLAEVYVQQHRFKEAVSVYRQLTEVYSDDAKPWVRLGVLHLKQQQISEATLAFKQAIAVDKNSAEAYNNLAWLYASQGGEPARAVELAERAVALDASASRLDTLAYAYYRHGAYFEAEQAILRAITLEPENAAYKDRLDEIRKAMEDEKKVRIAFAVRPDKILLILLSVLICTSVGYAVTFVEVATESGIDFKHTDGESGKRLFNEQYGSGGGFFDYDNDGHLDIYLINARPQGAQTKAAPPTNILYYNNGDGTFTDVTDTAGVGDTGYGVGATTGDYDNDGDIDLYLTNFGPNVLYRNNGDGTFTNVAETARVADAGWGTSCAFADFDNDGFLELYITNYADYTLDAHKTCYRHDIAVYCGPSSYPPQPDVFYHNNRDGTFRNLTEQSGLLSVPAAHGLGVAVGDADNDGDADIYVANDQDFNFLFENRGDGTFEEIGLLSGVSCSDMGKAEAGMGVAFADYDNDGKLDLTVSNFQNETNTLYHNEGDNFFVDTTIPAGIAEHTHRYLGWGIGFLDYDNDGDKDIFVANGHTMDNIAEVDRSTTTPQQNRLFRNLGNGEFVDVTAQMGAGFALRKTSRAAAFGDYDNDGDLDILITNWNQTADLLRNDGGNQNNWVQVQAIGTKSNRSAIGARVKVVTDERIQYAEVKSSGSYLAFSDLRVHFGLKDADNIDLLEIRWPSGIVDTATHLSVNQRFIAVEGDKIAPE